CVGKGRATIETRAAGPRHRGETACDQHRIRGAGRAVRAVCLESSRKEGLPAATNLFDSFDAAFAPPARPARSATIEAALRRRWRALARAAPPPPVGARARPGSTRGAPARLSIVAGQDKRH